MKLHEYQAKELLAAYGVPVPQHFVAASGDEARDAAAKLGGRGVVKAQVHAGGRGKAGGVKIANDPAEAAQIAESLSARPWLPSKPVRKALRYTRCSSSRRWISSANCT